MYFMYAIVHLPKARVITDENFKTIMSNFDGRGVVHQLVSRHRKGHWVYVSACYFLIFWSPLKNNEHPALEFVACTWSDVPLLGNTEAWL